MTLAHLVAVALVACSLPAFTQNQPAATSSEPWRLINPADAIAGKNSLDRFRIDDYKLFQFKSDGHSRIFNLDADSGLFASSLDSAQDADATCYAIRSYVVARDNKDSDSTHPAGYSTCRPASRYRVKNAELRKDSNQ